MAAAEEGLSLDTVLFPEGSDPTALDRRPVARMTLVPDRALPRDPVFAQVPARRSNKEQFDVMQPVAAGAMNQLGAALRTGMRFGGKVAASDVAALRSLTQDALRIEIETPRTFRKSVDLFRIGYREVDANPDEIDFSGPLFEAMHLTGKFTRGAAAYPASFAFRSGRDTVLATAGTGMGYVWLVSANNSRQAQIETGADWLRVKLAATALGLGLHPLSQALQEFPEMEAPHRAFHERLAPEGGTVQMLARIGYGPAVGQSPRWPLESSIMHG